MAFFKLLHISDLHFGSQARQSSIFDPASIAEWLHAAGQPQIRVGFQGTHCPTLAQEVARFVRNHRDLLDAVIISGDVATTGMQSDLLAALEFVSAQPDHPKVEFLTRDGKGTIFNPSGPEIYLMPGNHDRFVNILGLPRSEHFDFIFSKYWLARNSVTHKIILDHDGEDHLALVFADFTLRSRRDASMGFWAGQGYAHQDVIQALVTETEYIKRKHDRAGIIWVFHFPPTAPNAEFSNMLMLHMHADVVFQARQNNILHILAGHIHKNKEFREGGILISCAGSACAYSDHKLDGNWLHLLTIKVENKSARIDTRQNFRYDDKIDGRFKEVLSSASSFTPS